jgi:hypothetical protein
MDERIANQTGEIQMKRGNIRCDKRGDALEANVKPRVSCKGSRKSLLQLPSVAAAFSALRNARMWFQFDASEDSEAPGSRECHSLDAIGSTLYLFGGNDQQQRMNAILTLNTGAFCRGPRAVGSYR